MFQGTVLSRCLDTVLKYPRAIAMRWIALSEKDTTTQEKRLGDAAEPAGPAPRIVETDFKSGRPQGPLGLVFLLFAAVHPAAQCAQLKVEYNLPS